MAIDYDAIKDGQRRMWSTGDYPDIARTIVELYRDANEAQDGSLRVQAEYLLTVAELPG